LDPRESGQKGESSAVALEDGKEIVKQKHATKGQPKISKRETPRNPKYVKGVDGVVRLGSKVGTVHQTAEETPELEESKIGEREGIAKKGPPEGEGPRREPQSRKGRNDYQIPRKEKQGNRIEGTEEGPKKT